MNPRFFYIKTHNYNFNVLNDNSNNEKHIFFDLDSIDCVEKEQKSIFTNMLSNKREEFIKLDYYVLNSLDNINNFVSVTSKFVKKNLLRNNQYFVTNVSN